MAAAARARAVNLPPGWQPPILRAPYWAVLRTPFASALLRRYKRGFQVRIHRNQRHFFGESDTGWVGEFPTLESALLAVELMI